MHIDHGAEGATGLAVSDIQMMKSALSFDLCAEVCIYLNKMFTNESKASKFHNEGSAVGNSVDQNDKDIEVSH